MHAFYSDSKKHDHDARARAYSDAMKKVYESYPDDHEAAAFYALSLLASEPHEDTTLANRKAAAAILEKLLVIERDHPGVAHYLIHSYDTPSLDTRAEWNQSPAPHTPESFRISKLIVR
jgi:hypothetical protein